MSAGAPCAFPRIALYPGQPDRRWISILGGARDRPDRHACAGKRGKVRFWQHVPMKPLP